MGVNRRAFRQLDNAARNLIRASVPERVAMLLTSHKSRAIFEALLHESELARTDPDPQFLHRPMRYDIGLPSPVI